MAKLTITNSGTVDDFKLTEVYAEYRKFSFHLVEKNIFHAFIIFIYLISTHSKSINNSIVIHDIRYYLQKKVFDSVRYK